MKDNPVLIGWEILPKELHPHECVKKVVIQFYEDDYGERMGSEITTVLDDKYKDILSQDEVDKITEQCGYAALRYIDWDNLEKYSKWGVA
jgi:hypothetical protein